MDSIARIKIGKFTVAITQPNQIQAERIERELAEYHKLFHASDLDYQATMQQCFTTIHRIFASTIKSIHSPDNCLLLEYENDQLTIESIVKILAVPGNFREELVKICGLAAANETSTLRERLTRIYPSIQLLSIGPVSTHN